MAACLHNGGCAGLCTYDPPAGARDADLDPDLPIQPTKEPTHELNPRLRHGDHRGADLMGHVRTPRDIYVLDEKGAPTDQFLCTVHAASEQSVMTVLGADPNAEDGHTRSQWLWFRLQNNDLILGCFPQDETYFECEVDAETPPLDQPKEA